MNCTTETIKVFNVRKEKSINILLWYHSTDRCPTVDPHKKDNQIQPRLTSLLKNRGMVVNPLKVFTEPFSRPVIFINVLSKNHKSGYHYRLNTSSRLSLPSHPILKWDRALCFVERNLSLWDMTRLKSTDGRSSYSSQLRRQRANTSNKHLHCWISLMCHSSNLHTFCYWR